MDDKVRFNGGKPPIKLQSLDPILENAQQAIQGGRWEDAIQAYHKAAEISPNSADIYLNLAFAYLASGQQSEAIFQYLWANYLKPDLSFETHLRLCESLVSIQQWNMAIVVCKKILDLKPNDFRVLFDLGLMQAQQGFIDEAIENFQHALAINPECGDIYLNLGSALTKKKLFQQAKTIYQEALRRFKGEMLAMLYFNYGSNEEVQGHWQEALYAYEQALAIQPNFPMQRFIIGMLLLRLGNYSQGWQEYEHRCQAYYSTEKVPQPMWYNQNLLNCRLLVCCEQGLGDTFQFLRYLPLLKQRGATLIVQAPAVLIPFLKKQSWLMVSEWFTQEEAIPAFDYWVYLLSLPQRLNTELASIPRAGDWQVTPSLMPKLPVTQKLLRVGLVWAGSPNHQNDHNRSIPLSTLEPLLLMNDQIEFYSLQYGPRNQEIQELHWQDRLTDLASELQSWEDSAQIMMELDLLITVDTATAHLSGSLGKPTWLLLPFIPDFRWLIDRTDSPWYPSMRLFRQPQADDWASVIENVKLALKHRVKHRESSLML